ncbi:MAG: S1 RNA-binding domain-containing protein, partial [Methanomicrobiales archaeon]|nr:S1 RNA-binding domain-containing protein [Methanomicrobiales archaeon]
MPTGTETIVYSLGDGCSITDIVIGKTYTGTIQGFANFGAFVYLNSSIKGLIHKSNMLMSHQEGDTVIVRVGNIRDNGNIDLEEIVISSYQIQPVVCKRRTTKLEELNKKVGRSVTLECQVAQVKQTSGPTIFTLVDES